MTDDRRQARYALIRVWWWAGNLAVFAPMYVWARPLFHEVFEPYVVAVTILTPLEAAWTAYAALSKDK